jgi:hypothetical protein
MVLQEVAAGKALRKATEKKVKKSKEDARHDELIEASKQKSA